MRALGAITLVLALASGCYKTTIRTGRLAGEPAPRVEDKWHSGVLSGTDELSGPYELDELCPDGWAEVTTHTSFGNAVVQHAAVHIYNPQTVDVTCAAK